MPTASAIVVCSGLRNSPDTFASWVEVVLVALAVLMMVSAFAEPPQSLWGQCQPPLLAAPSWSAALGSWPLIVQGVAMAAYWVDVSLKMALGRARTDGESAGATAAIVVLHRGPTTAG